MTAQAVPVEMRVSPTEAWAIEPIWEAPADAGQPSRGRALPAALADRHGADLVIPLHDDRPTVIANFVSTLDGVVAFDPGGPGGGRAVSGDLEADRFLMGLLRAIADAVLVGAGTVRASSSRSWTPARAHPGSADAFEGWRRALGLSPQPMAVLVTGSGVLDPERPWRPRGDQPLVVMTTERGAARLSADGVADVEVLPTGLDGRIPMDAMLERLGTRGVRLLLCEAGPTVFGELVAAHLVDELFLTLAPRLAGREGALRRPGLVEGVAFGAALAPSARVRSIMRSGDHLFLRYALGQHGSARGGSS